MLTLCWVAYAQNDKAPGGFKLKEAESKTQKDVESQQVNNRNHSTDFLHWECRKLMDSIFSWPEMKPLDKLITMPTCQQQPLLIPTFRVAPETFWN